MIETDENTASANMERFLTAIVQCFILATEQPSCRPSLHTVNAVNVQFTIQGMLMID